MTTPSQSIDTNGVHPPADKAPEYDLRPVVRDGVAHATMLGCGENFLGAFAISLQGTPFQIGTLASFPPFVGALSQLLSIRITEFFQQRRRVVVTAAILQALLWVPMALLPFVFGVKSHTVSLLIATALFYYICAGICAPAWSSLVGDLVPADRRGRFFGRRNMFIGIATFLGIAGGGAVLQFFSRLHWPLLGFLAIFLFAGSARLLSAYWLSQYTEPPYHVRADEKFSLIAFLRRSVRSNFGRFALFRGTMMFSAYISAPYFSLFMLRELGFDYGRFTIVTGFSTVAGFLTMQHWGRITDTFGNKKVLTVCGYGVSIVPFLWLVSGNLWYLLVLQAYAGFAWAGFNLAADNFIFDAVKPAKRTRAVAYQGVIYGAFVMAGSYVGSFLLETVPRDYTFSFWSIHLSSPLPFIFFISGILRLLTCVVWVSRFIEVRNVPPIRHRDLLFQISQVRAFSGLQFSLFPGRSNGKGKHSKE